MWQYGTWVDYFLQPKFKCAPDGCLIMLHNVILLIYTVYFVMLIVILMTDTCFFSSQYRSNRVAYKRDFLFLCLLTKCWCWQMRACPIGPISLIMLFCKTEGCHPLWIKRLFCLFVMWRCQYAQVKGKKPFVYHTANKHRELNISSHEEARQGPPRLRRQWAWANRVCVILFLWCLLVNVHVLPWRPPHLTYLTRACSSESRSTLSIDVLTRLCVCLLIN